MELVLSHLDTEPLPEPIKEFEFSNKRLLNSTYKSTVKQNFINSSKSVFSVRQHLKFKRFNTINHVAVILKLSIFAVILSIMF